MEPRASPGVRRPGVELVLCMGKTVRKNRSRLLAHHLLALLGIQSRRLAHVGVHLAGGDVVMGLAHHGVGRIAGGVDALVALMRQAQALFGLARDRESTRLKSSHLAIS